MQFSNNSQGGIRMSKTYRKVVCFSDYNPTYTPWAKRQASKKVRRKKDIGNGCSYKKCFESWNIFDYKFSYYSKQDVERDSIRYSYKTRQMEEIWSKEEKAKFFPLWYKRSLTKKI